MNQDGGNGGEINEARWREAQVGTITRLNQVISTLTDRMERIEIALGNLQGREVLLNEGVENEEDDNVTLLAGHSPRGGRDVGRGRGRVRRRGREILAPKRIEREYQYERENEKGVWGVKLKIPTFYGRSDPEEYLQYESKIEHVFDCNNFSEERKLKLAVAEFCDYAIIWWTYLKSEWRRNYEEPIETWEELRTLMRKRYIPKHYSRVLKQKLYTLQQGSKSVEEYYKEMETLMNRACIDEDEEDTMARFLGGLNRQLAHQVDRQAYFDMQELLHLAVKIEGQLAWEKDNSKRYGISKSITFNTWKKNANIEKIDFKVGGKYDLDKKNKAETSKGKEKAEEYKEIRKRNRDIKCWKCQGIGHLSRDCPNKRVMIIKNGQVVTDSEESDHDELVEEEIQENEEELEDGSHLGTPCSLVIDSGSCTNVVSTMLIKRLLIPTQHHPKPYKLQWLNDSGTMKEFDDVFQDEVPKGLPPIRGIEHKIDFIPGAVIPNRLAYRANPTETQEI
ncbi:uncharacterized protein LOC111795765 [Cucurbita pepo subsp. pepo]|uniref:uncharacterized protein LOC111795765 n=1 Tax=Cucurbita pepo subsp. pepo TaxID=3664 RepID=UPI000C9D8307|nr:uncharacterized protein LOC111795765 [Cucurbita pepo subsp. pepo]